MKKLERDVKLNQKKKKKKNLEDQLGYMLIFCDFTYYICFDGISTMADHVYIFILINEPPRGKTNNVVFEQVRHKPACTSTEKS